MIWLRYNPRSGSNLDTFIFTTFSLRTGGLLLDVAPSKRVSDGITRLFNLAKQENCVTSQSFWRAASQSLLVAGILLSGSTPSSADGMMPDLTGLAWSTEAVSATLSTDLILFKYSGRWILLPAGYITPTMSQSELLPLRTIYEKYLNTPFTPAEEEKWASRIPRTSENVLPAGPGDFAYMLPSGLPLPKEYFSSGVAERRKEAPFEARGRDPDFIIKPKGFKGEQIVVRFSWASPNTDNINEWPLTELFERKKFNIGASAVGYREGPSPRLPRDHVERPTGRSIFKIYGDDGDIAVDIDCTPWVADMAPPNPGCIGYVLHRESRLEMYLMFPSLPTTTYENEAWRSIVDNTVSLVLSWKFQPFAVKSDD
ncbi:hypothetical protein [Paenirhodobacter sp.]|uniref:hypothetical protein n=1 Tax=Paenirhodobacter sp. TaxID=1965326 RepID=UPI003B3CFD28